MRKIKKNKGTYNDTAKGFTGEEFVENLNTDEIRSGFLVTSHRKKLWNVQIGLINEFARICKKYDLRWFAYGGTLLGAARHGGFIPWDDDVDILMLRPEYEKFKQVAAEEIKAPYFLDAWYDYRLEEDEKTLQSESDLPFITRKDKDQHLGYWPFLPLLKIRDSRTSMIELPNRKNVNQGIWIDIFPMDPLPPFTDEKQATIFEAEGELLLATVFPKVIQDAMANNQKFCLNTDIVEKFLSMPYREKALTFENFMSEHFFSSEYVGQIRNHFLTRNFHKYKTKKFEEKVIYLPFEKIKLPAPVDYDEHLKEMYGDWHKLVMQVSHSQNWSADIPYDEYLNNVVS